MSGRRTAFVVHPSERDRLNTSGRDHGAAVDLVWFEEDDPSPVRLLERAERDPRFAEVDGVFGSADASAHLAVRLAATRSLPGPTPEAFMRCHDKLASRRYQREVVPEATPRFFAIDPARPLPSALPLPFPLFVKPVAAHLSQMAYEVRDRHGLERVFALARGQLDSIAAFDERLEGRSFHLMLAEELLTGRLVTFEAYMRQGEMTPIGVTDSVMHPNGISFLRFEYPSELPRETQEAMVGVAARLMPALGFDGSLFNIEFFVGPDGTAKIVEVNGRMASQFAPLVRAVHGVSSYELQLELITGGTPELPPARQGVVASSFVLRHYEDAVVTSTPDPTEVHERWPGSQIELLVRRGQRLSDNDDDAASHRLAVVALSGPDRGALIRRWDVLREQLEFGLVPLGR